ncbi:hypothetical protein [Paracoccus chinensis]|uniref:Putative MFS transporter, AGZA family, xanthine/uracil permease n=1 Tax=Paracoccus chinensis TaxID=525640 RepID=A0A1G9LT34_9RHOB|nr:hypothetical protein [Paracoccus chinensis]SDL65160.1 putative MFS transporter, AGZA family, xanthine/uracil permease [Paracoccus chinensis]
MAHLLSTFPTHDPIDEYGRTDLTALTVAVLFLLATFLAPSGSVPAATWIAAALFVMRFVFFAEG